MGLAILDGKLTSNIKAMIKQSAPANEMTKIACSAVRSAIILFREIAVIFCSINKAISFLIDETIVTSKGLSFSFKKCLAIAFVVCCSPTSVTFFRCLSRLIWKLLKAAFATGISSNANNIFLAYSSVL
ncbi:hypothetical protein D3C81_1479190 [compost metagenome]